MTVGHRPLPEGALKACYTAAKNTQCLLHDAIYLHDIRHQMLATWPQAASTDRGFLDEA